MNPETKWWVGAVSILILTFVGWVVNVRLSPGTIPSVPLVVAVGFIALTAWVFGYPLKHVGDETSGGDLCVCLHDVTRHAEDDDSCLDCECLGWHDLP